MARRAWFLSLFLAIIMSLGVLSIKGFTKEQKSSKTDDVVSEKIDEVLKNQQDIIARLEDIRAQQDIIRIRASRK
ncbi:MAG: hypothetical protein KJ706_03305 [Candidatus Omnitrophica bacterium]|nr:hypothetical protein [Candidatus Omnitrophota bacterium]MBU4590221.1 hypothetical protein [Candidatus Omnitrophota bacterium]